MTKPTAAEMVVAETWLAGVLGGSRLPLAAQYGGQPLGDLAASWPREVSSAVLDDHRTAHTITCEDPATGLTVRWEAIAYNDFPAVEWLVYLENRGQTDTPILADLQALDYAFPAAKEQRCWVHHSRGSQFRLEDFEPFETPLVLGVIADLRLATVGGRSSDGALPFMNLQIGDTGVIVAIGWTGDWAATFHRDEAAVVVQAGMQKMHLTLHPGERIRTPRIALIFWQADRWHGQNLLRRFILAHHTPQSDGKPVVVPVTEGAWGEFPVDSHLAQIRWIQEHRIPADALWLDAGWYGDAPADPNASVWTRTWAKQVGSWYPNKALYPQGLKPIGDALRDSGLGFILWFEPERVAEGTEICREHPEFLTGRWWSKYIGNWIYLFNLGDPAARQWMVERISALITEFGVTIYRQDFNMAPGPVWAEADAADRVGMSEIRHIEGLYAFWDELLARHPGLVIDNCSSGGRRIDLESISRGITLTRSDLNDWPLDDDRLRAMQTLTHGLSPWYPVALAGVQGGDAYRVRSALAPGFGMGWSYSAIIGHKEVAIDQVLPLLAEALSVRDFFYGDFYPLISFSLGRDAWAAWQLDLPEREEGIVQVFRREESPIEAGRFALHGLEPGAEYDLVDADGGPTIRVIGQELMARGLAVSIAERPAARLFRYHKVQGLRSGPLQARSKG